MPARQPSVDTATALAVEPTEALLRSVVRALDEKKARDLRVLRVTDQSTITDYLVVASGNAEPHLRALRIELEKVLDAAGAKIAGIEIGAGSGWLVVDAYQIMVHLFLPAQREAYRLEQLWRDAQELDVPGLLAPPPTPAAPRKKAVKKAATTKKVARKTAVKKKSVTRKAAPTPAKRAPARKAAAKRARGR